MKVYFAFIGPYMKLQPECNPANRMKRYMPVVPPPYNQMDAQETKVKTKKGELLVIDAIDQ